MQRLMTPCASLGLLLIPSLLYAQASITGVVRDTSGAVLPGVSVEASSPALIEKVRSVATNDAGQYRIENLRPGSYTVTFALSGFGDRINLWLARADGAPAGSRNFDTGLLFSDYVTAADFDGDGFSDAAVGDNFDNHIAFLQNDGAGGLHLTQTVELGRGVFNVRAMDIDGDGKPDVLVPVDNGIKVLRNHSTPGNLAFDVLPGVGPDAFVVIRTQLMTPGK